MPVAPPRRATPQSTNVVAYLRVSTEEQATSGLGLDAQRTAINAEATRRGWTVVGLYEDAGVSASRKARPGLDAALAALSRGEAHALVVMKLDRLARSLTGYAKIVERAEREGWSLDVLDGIDGRTSMGNAMRGMAVVFAELERGLIGQRTREALTAARARGQRLGGPRTMPDEVRARIVALREQGTTLQAIADALNADGVPTAQGGARWYKSTVAAALRSVALDEDAAARRADWPPPPTMPISSRCLDPDGSTPTTARGERP